MKVHRDTWLIYKSLVANTEVRLPLYLLFGGKRVGVLNKHQDNHADFFKLSAPSSLNKEFLSIATLFSLNNRIPFHTARHTYATFLIYSEVHVLRFKSHWDIKACSQLSLY